MPDDTATDPTPTGPTPVARKKAAKAAAAPQPKPVDAGRKLLDQLSTDAPPIPPTDPVLYARGSVISAIALHTSPDLWIRVTAYNHPDADRAVTGTDPADIEILAVSIPALDQIAGALPWTSQPSTRRDVDPVSGRTHIVTRGVLWGVRVAVAGIEPVGGAA